MTSAFTPDQNRRFAENKRLSAIANEKVEAAQKLEQAYHNSPEAKRLRKAVEDAIDEVNVLVDKWNDIVMERHNKEKRGLS